MSIAKKDNNFRKTITAVWDEFVYSSGLVAVGDILVMCTFSFLLNIYISTSFLIVVFLSILAVNFFNRYKEIETDQLTNPKRSLSIKKYLKFAPYIMTLLLAASVLITILFSTNTALLFMLVLFCFGCLYTTVLKKVTKKIVGFKNFMTAIPYALLVFFLVIYHEEPIGLAAILISIFYLMRMFINTTYFDIKDELSDKKEGLKTLPVVYGSKKTKIILQIINYLSIIPIVIGIFCNVLPLYSIGLIFTIFYARRYLKIKNVDNQKFVYNVIVDGEFVFWPVYVLLTMVVIS